MDISAMPIGKSFRVSGDGFLINIDNTGKDKWVYTFYRNTTFEDTVNMEAALAPVELSGAPWIQTRYKNSILSDCIVKTMNCESEIAKQITDLITKSVYDVSGEYILLQQAASGYDYKDTVHGIPKSTVKAHIHPAIDCVDRVLYIGYRFIDESFEQKEWFINSDQKTYTAQELLEEKIVVTPKDIIGSPRWKNVLLDTNTFDTFQLFTMLKKKLEYHIWFQNPQAYDILSLWIMGTYMYWAFDSYPYIHLSGTPDSGKSRVQRLSSCLTFNGYFTESISNSSIFRYVEDMRATLHIDEQEFLSTEGALETVSILNSGYHKAGNATRQEGITDKNGDRKFRTISFTTYSPKMLSGIRGLDRTLSSRSINIPMKPTTNKKYSRNEIDSSDPVWQNFRDQLYAWALKNFNDVMAAYDESKNLDIEVKNRMWQKYHPLIAIAYYFKKQYPTSTLFDSVVEFIKIDQIKVIDFTDYTIDLAYKAIFSRIQKLPNPKGEYTLKSIREEAANLMGLKEFDINDPSLDHIKNIHVTLQTIGIKTIPLAGNFRGIRITNLEALEEEALARGIRIRTPLITL